MDCQWKCHHILYLIIGLGWFCISLSVEISPPPCYIISIMGFGGFWIRLSMDMSPLPCYNHRFGKVPDRIVNGNVCHHILAIIIGLRWFWIRQSMDISRRPCRHHRLVLVPDRIVNANVTISLL